MENGEYFVLLMHHLGPKMTYMFKEKSSQFTHHIEIILPYFSSHIYYYKYDRTLLFQYGTTLTRKLL